MKSVLKILFVTFFLFGENFVYSCCMGDDDFKEAMRQETEARSRGVLRGGSVAPAADRKDSPLPHKDEKNELLKSCIRTGNVEPYFSFLKQEVTEKVNSMYWDSSMAGSLPRLKRFIKRLQISDFEYIARPRAGDTSASVPFGLRLESALLGRVATFITDGV